MLKYGHTITTNNMDALPREMHSMMVRNLDRTAAARLASTNRHFRSVAADSTTIKRLKALSKAITDKTLTFDTLLKEIASSDAGIVGKLIPERDMQQCVELAERQCAPRTGWALPLLSLLRIVKVAFDDAPDSIGSRTSVAFTVHEDEDDPERKVTVGFEGEWPEFNAVCNVVLTWTHGRPMDFQLSGTASVNALLLLNLITGGSLRQSGQVRFKVLKPIENGIKPAWRPYAAKLFLSKWAGAAVGASNLFTVPEHQVYLHGPFTDLAAV